MLVDQSGFNIPFLYVRIPQCKIGNKFKISCDLGLFLSYSLVTQHFPCISFSFSPLHLY